MTKAYHFKERADFAQKGVDIISDYLMSLSCAVSVVNVENNSEYQDKDIDLIWKYENPQKKLCECAIEVKTDSYTTGNFWLETISNDAKNTEGCFLKSRADYFFYYFEKLDVLYIIPLKAAQKWLRLNMDRFRESITSTKDKKSGTHLYHTIGRIVPIETLRAELKKADCIIREIRNISQKAYQIAS